MRNLPEFGTIEVTMFRRNRTGMIINPKPIRLRREGKYRGASIAEAFVKNGGRIPKESYSDGQS